jgi:hypothetical protein
MRHLLREHGCLWKPKVLRTTPRSWLPQRFVPTNFSRLLQRVNDWWVLEATGLLISIGAAGAAVGVLRLYNGRPLQEWRYHLSINTVISFLAIISKSSLALVVEGCLGQLKWIWYSGPRKHHSLLDFQTFDGASRGPYGAAQLLLTLREIDIGLVGTFVMLCALVYEPFIQQTISTPLLSSSLSTNSSLPIATAYAAYGFGRLPMVVDTELPMKAAIYDGIFYQNVSTTATAISPTCSTGNCTFEQYSSLFVCSRCVNVTSLIQSTCTSGNSSPSSPYCVYTLPNGLNATGDTIFKTSTGALSTMELDNAGPVISNFSSILISTDDPAPAFSALDCILYFCAKIYHSSVVRGTFHKTTEATVHADSVQNGGPNLTVTVPPSLLSSAKHEAFAVQGGTADALTDYLQRLLAGDAYSLGLVSDAPLVEYSTDVIQALYTNNDINQTMTNLATAMGNHIRLKGASYASGTTDAMVTFIHVRWLWLILPFSLEALTLITLIATVILSAVRAVPIWKSSALAPMFHGVHVDITKSARVENTEETLKRWRPSLSIHRSCLSRKREEPYLRSIPNLHDAEPLLPMKSVVTGQDGSPS